MTAAYRAAEQLAEIIRRAADNPRQDPVPILDDDPDDQTSLWLLEEGRLRARGADGTIFEFVSVDQARPAVPTFGSDPAASTGWRLWFTTDGQLRGRLASGTVITIGPTATTATAAGGSPAVGSSTSAKPKPDDPTPTRHREEYAATWGRMFCSKHGEETGSELHYGDLGSGYHGARKIMLGFDDSTIRADLAGATIKRVQIRSRNLHAWGDAGIRVRWGGHRRSAPPSAYTAVRRDVWSAIWPKTGYGAAWRTAATWLGSAFKNDVIRGLVVDQGPGKSEYGSLEWESVRIAVEFVK